MSDLVTFGETALRLATPGSERLERADELRVHAAGAESNVAITAARLGADATWLSKVPDTPLGRRAVSEVRSHGVETAVAWSDAGRQGLRFHEAGADPRESQAVHDRGGTAAATADPGELEMDAVGAADAVYVSGTTAALSRSAAETVGAVLGAGGDALTALGLDHRPGLWSASEARETLTQLFPAVDLLVANEDEARTVLGATGQPRQLAHTVASEHDFEIVVITRSEFGALAYHDNVIHEQSAFETPAVDPGGQHDAFAGAFLHRLVEGAGVADALTDGVAAAALARTVPGPVPTVDPAGVEDVAGRLEDTGP